MDVSEYLSRIGVVGTKPSPTLEALKALQRAHLLTVPFENLDIHWEFPIVLDTESFYNKIVVRGRGGFCYELNGLFNELLSDLCFETRLISARVFNGREHGPEYDHAAIIVTIDGQEYLTDVGFGSFTAEPLKFDLEVEQHDTKGVFSLRKREDGYFEVSKREAGTWRSEYLFKDADRDLSEFADMCNFQQQSPDSHFRKGKLCSIMTDDGRKTLTEKSFIVTTAGDSKTETPITSDNDFYDTLKREFGIRRQ